MAYCAPCTTIPLTGLLNANTLQVLVVHGTEDKVCRFSTSDYCAFFHVILQVCSVETSKQFIEKLAADDKRISLYEVCSHESLFALLLSLTVFILKGGYHELQNEPNGVKEKFTDECVAWVESHFPTAAEDTTQAKL